MDEGGLQSVVHRPTKILWSHRQQIRPTALLPYKTTQTPHAAACRGLSAVRGALRGRPHAPP